MNVYLLRIENLEKPLPEKFREKAKTLRNLADQWRAVYSDLLMQSVLARELGKDPDIQRELYGKPFCQGRHFNLSHSGKTILMATDKTPVGVDVEFIRPLSDLEEMADFLAESEKRDILSKSGPERLKLFYEYWTLKESYVKALGEGLGKPLRSFVDPGWHFKRYDLGPEYANAVCARHSDFPKFPKIISVKELM